jgi:branched-chain amino acid transport system ATP-binding protein
MPILETKELTKQFGELTAVHRMDFEIEQGEIVGIIGPNGAGKTTFVNLLTGVLDATSGEIVFDGTVLGNSPVHSRAQSGLVRSFQIPQICDDLTLLENVRSAVLSRERRNNSLFSVLSLESESRDEAYELLETFGLADRADTEADTIPHGDKKILDVCMSVAMRPKLLVLDEPTSGVATDNKHEIMDRLDDYFQTTDSAVLFIEHDMELIAEYAERVLAMDRGEKLAEGAPQEVLENEQVKRRIRGEEE